MGADLLGGPLLRELARRAVERFQSELEPRELLLRAVELDARVLARPRAQGHLVGLLARLERRPLVLPLQRLEQRALHAVHHGVVREVAHELRVLLVAGLVLAAVRGRTAAAAVAAAAVVAAVVVAVAIVVVVVVDVWLCLPPAPASAL